MSTRARAPLDADVERQFSVHATRDADHHRLAGLTFFSGDGALADLPALRRRLNKKVREQGFEVSRDELIKGAVAVAVPVFLGDGQVIGSLAVFGPGVRVDEERLSFLRSC